MTSFAAGSLWAMQTCGCARRQIDEDNGGGLIRTMIDEDSDGEGGEQRPRAETKSGRSSSSSSGSNNEVESSGADRGASGRRAAMVKSEQGGRGGRDAVEQA
eukprot:1143797-Pelagomonas_calceolata.AAC.2